ncbi:MAG: cupin domain-containing protein [Caldilinea sp. CFX5]|nr:cupin domain-containing protein [Caldilinea sp. CFX5]
MKVRRVVTGHTPDGKSTIASDEEVEATTVALKPGLKHHRLWGADMAPTFPNNGAPQPMPAFFPPVGGFRFGLFTLPPESVATAVNVPLEVGLQEVEEKLPGMLAVHDPDGSGMHTTNTVDFEYIISGEVWLELDDGVEIHLRAGDTVVQNGTRHNWHNRATIPCQMVLCMVGSQRSVRKERA